jgi:cell wall-associated NlpC family hydrolase
MRVLDENTLLPGDIVLTSGPGKASRVIKRASRSNYSHAMLYVASGSVIHSDLNGVHAANPIRMPFSAENEPLVLRLREISDEQVIRTICDYARAQIGTQYSVPEAVASAFARSRAGRSKQNRQFCSRLVAEAYAAASVHLVPNPSYCYPSDLANLEVMVRVEQPLRDLTPAEVRFISKPSPLEAQTAITNDLFRRLRLASSEDIQTHDQIVECLLRRPELDEAFSEILASSGYLDMWRMDVAINPWRYDAEARQRIKISEQQRQWEIRESMRDIRRFRQAAHDYYTLHASSPRMYFLLSHRLYADLFAVHATRLKLAREA